MNGIYLLTDSLSLLETVIDTGINAVQLRSKKKVNFTKAKQMKELCQSYNIPFIINDRVDLALAINADGVHLGQKDLPIEKARLLLGKKKIIGISTGTLLEMKRAVAEGADYLGVGHIFNTKTKRKEGLPLGISFLKKIASQIPIPIVAIGGIQHAHVKEIKEASTSSIAICSAIAQATSPREAAKQFVRLWNATDRKSN